MSVPREQGRQAEDWPAIQSRFDELKAVLPSLADLPPAAPETALKILFRISDEVVALRRRSIRDRTQLAGLRELVDTLLRGGDPDEDLLTMVRYLCAVFELREVLLLRKLPSEGWVSYHAGAHDRRGTRRGPFPSLAGTSRPEEADPSRYPLAFELGLGDSGVGSASRKEGAPDQLGLLCFMPEGQGGGDDWDPREIAQGVEGMLGTLHHREAMEGAARFRRQLLESMGDGLLAVDPEGTILEINRAAAGLLGLSPIGAQGASIEVLEPGSAKLVGEIRRALQLGQSLPPQELALGGAESPVPVTVSITALRDGQEQFRGLVLNLTDLTEVRVLEEQMRRLDRLAALGRFAAWVAHEIRNPLAGIGAGVEYLRGRLDSLAPEQEDLRFVLAETQRLNRIVSELLDYARPRPLHQQPMEVGELVPQVEHALEPLLAGRGIKLECQGPLTLGFSADPDRVHQVLLNLVKNAVEAAPAGSAVRLEWSLYGGEGGAGLGVVRFLIIDRGPGMTADEQAQAFEPFYTTKASGTGLGLHMAQAIAQQHGGSLRLLSVPGEGTTAILELPAAQAEWEEQDAIVHSHRG